jgi:hypothetical protein
MKRCYIQRANHPVPPCAFASKHRRSLLESANALQAEVRRRTNELVRQVAQVTGRERAFWFYVTDPDNCLSVVNWVRTCNYECALDSQLSNFETEPAIQGGVSRLGLLGSSGQWLLLHEYHPDEEFSISFHGPLTTCDELEHVLRCSGVQN